MSQLRPAVFLLLLLTLITGLIYPLLTTALAQWWFPSQANGSLLITDGKTQGSALIGQNFTQPDYFWGRPSATGDSRIIHWRRRAAIWRAAIRPWIKR